ncbi:MAG: hypothetical protein ACLF0P_16740, partial [Thermoanaerobaculia bacterium]
MRRLRPLLRSRWSPALLVAAASLGLAGTLAAELDRRAGQTVAVGPGDVVPDDLYAVGETVRIEGTVQGDLVTTARRVIVAGTVEGDLLALGQSVLVDGTVGDDARVAAQVLRLGPGARLADDLVSAGFSVEAADGSSVGGSVVALGYQALLAGEVAERLLGSFAALELAGTIEGDVEVSVGPADDGAPGAFWPTEIPIPPVDPGLTVSDAAQLGGDLRYESPDAGEIAPGARVAGEVTHEEVTPAAEEEPSPVEHGLDAIRRLVALLLVGGLLLLAAPRWTASLTDLVRRRPLPSLGWGVIFLAVALVAAAAVALATALGAAVFGLLTLGGLVVTVIGGGILAELGLALAVLLAAAYLAPVIVSLAGGRLAVARGAAPTGELSRGARFAALALGALVLVLAGLV